MTSLTKRMMVRFAAEDEAWIAEQAADEGVDNATFVRMVINRLRRGRPALMRDALARTAQHNPQSTDDRAPIVRSPVVARPLFTAPVEEEEAVPADEAVEALLEQRLAEAEQGYEDTAPVAPGGNGAAVSHRHIARQQYNPGRT